MSEKLIPEHIDPFRYAEQGLQIAGIAKMQDMPRLALTIGLNTDHAKVDLRFGVDEQQITYLKGRLEAKLTLQCQRCMQPLIYDIIADFALGIVNTLDEANALPDHYEPALAQEGQLALRELVEDELILNLPIIPKHEPDECEVELPTLQAGEEQGKGKNPFQVLESLKHKQ